jgi:hypothetical protein
MAYAKGTEVPVEKTEMEIKQLLKKHGASAVITGWSGDRAQVLFEMKDRRIRFTIDCPPISDFAYAKIGVNGKRRRTQAEQKTAYEQSQREKWRVLLLLIKGKLESIESGAGMFEQEFLSYIVLPDNETVGEWITPQLKDIYRSGKMPPMLPGAAIALPAPKESK